MTEFSRFEQPAASQRPAGLCCTGFGWSSPSSACGLRTLPHFAAVLVEAGSGHFESLPSGPVHVQAPALFWLFPGVPHTYRPDPAGWSERWTMFEGTQADALLALEYLAPRHPLLALEGTMVAEVSALFDGLQRDFTRQTRFAPLLSGAWVHRLIVACHVHQLEQPQLEGRMRVALGALEDAAFAPLDLAALARAHGFSPATFRRRVRSLTGCSPQEYLTRLRLARAKSLLARSEHSVFEVAHQCGFEDPFYFSRMFQKIEGLSPSAFRRQQRR